MFRRLAPSLLATLTLSLGGAAFAGPVAALDPIIVNAAGNQEDLDAGAGGCDVDVAVGDQCTFRAALQTANVRTGADTIQFSFAGTGPIVIGVPAALPKISDPVTIDGYSVAGARPNTRSRGTNAVMRIVLKGPGDNAFDGLTVDAPADISGLVVQRFRRGMLFIENGSGSKVWGNFVGTNAAGTTKAGNTLEGIHVDCLSAVEIGGTTPARRNIISGNNVGILLCEQAVGTTIRGNLIGTKADGRSGLGNADAGIKAMGTQSVSIGGMTAGSANVLAYNAVGIHVQTYLGVRAEGVQVLRNSMRANAGLGIDIERDGVTPNDGLGDADIGANGRQNFPLVRRATRTSSGTTIRGSLSSAPHSTYRLLFFSTLTASRQGDIYVATKTVTTDSTGLATFTVASSKKVPAGSFIVATATDQSTGDTSEFSRPRRTAS